jgi:hypothetical protein
MLVKQLPSLHVLYQVTFPRYLHPVHFARCIIESLFKMIFFCALDSTNIYHCFKSGTFYFNGKFTFGFVLAIGGIVVIVVKMNTAPEPKPRFVRDFGVKRGKKFSPPFASVDIG